MGRATETVSSEKSTEIKQEFLSSAISDISAYIQLMDTKVSIIMGALVALIAGILACYQPVSKIIATIKPCSWIGVLFAIVSCICIVNVIMVFVFGILTIRTHVSIINYESKWFLIKDTKQYSFDSYLEDVRNMTDADTIDNMTAELYKLNDINRQKARTMKWVIRAFSVSLICLLLISLLFLISVI